MRFCSLGISCLLGGVAIAATPLRGQSQPAATGPAPIVWFARADIGLLQRTNGATAPSRVGPTLQLGLQATPTFAFVVEGSVFATIDGGFDERAELIAVLVRARGHRDLAPLSTYLEGGITNHRVEDIDPDGRHRRTFGTALTAGAGAEYALSPTLDVRVGLQLIWGPARERRESGAFVTFDDADLSLHRIQVGLGWRLPF